LSFSLKNIETLRELDTVVIEELSLGCDKFWRRLYARRLEVIELRYRLMFEKACDDLNSPKTLVWSTIPEEKAKQEARRTRARARRSHSHQRLELVQLVRSFARE
jgi:hypothetical protein